MIASLIVRSAFVQGIGGFRFGMDLGASISQNRGIGALFNLKPQIMLKDNLAF